MRIVASGPAARRSAARRETVPETYGERRARTQRRRRFVQQIRIGLLSLRRVTAAHDHHVGALVATRLVALGRRAPRRDRMAAAVGTPAMRMVDRIHRDAAHRRADAAPALRTGLADRAQAVLLVAHFADRGPTVDVHAADLAGAQSDLRVDAFTREQLHAGTR